MSKNKKFIDSLNTQMDHVQIICDTRTPTHKPCSDQPRKLEQQLGQNGQDWATITHFFALIFASTANSGLASKSQICSPVTWDAPAIVSPPPASPHQHFPSGHTWSHLFVPTPCQPASLCKHSGRDVTIPSRWGGLHRFPHY